MCEASGCKQRPIADLVTCVNVSLPDQGLGALRDETENCPACILAAIRQCGGHRPAFTLMTYGYERCLLPDTDPVFSYKEDCKEWWVMWNEDHGGER